MIWMKGDTMSKEIMPIIVVHGGAGTIPEERRPAAEKGVLEAVDLAWKCLEDGGTALDAVEIAVSAMEDNENFNAGKGSVVTENSTTEMDALIMDGKDLRVGGVIGVGRVKNPIVLSRQIMEKSKHVLFTKEGAEKLAEEYGIELVDPSYFVTDRIKERLARYFDQKQKLDETDPEGRDKYGTVGAVALDKDGNLAAATSTGGVLGKQIGRVGDTPIIGAGTYADNELAISATGVGEYIIRGMLGLRVKWNLPGKTIVDATNDALHYVNDQVGPAGIICVRKDGTWAAEKTTKDLVYAVKSDSIEETFMKRL